MTHKNRPITAHLRVRNGRYYAIFYHNGKDGNPKEIWRSLDLEAKPGNKRRAEARMEEMRQQLKGVLDVSGYRIPFVEYAMYYIEKKKGEVEESTHRSIKHCVEKQIWVYFAPMDLSLSEVKPSHIQHFYEHLYKSGRADGSGGLSISSIKHIKSILNEIFKMAVIEELVLTNPVEGVRLPAKDNPRKQYTVLNQESANQLLGYVYENEVMYPFLLITLRYGLRLSEAAGLKWGAVDFREGCLRIESVLTRGPNPEKNKTKTATSNAKFPLLPDVIEALKIRRKAQARQRGLLGEVYVENDYVFTRDDGRYLTHEWVRTEFKKALEGAGLPHMRFHDLRHSTACIMHSNGMGIQELKKWMRHGKLSMTADVYLHISKEREKELADGLKNMFADDCTIEDDFTERNFKRA